MLGALGYPTKRQDIVRFVCMFFVMSLLPFTILADSRASILMLFSSRNTDGVITHDADPNNHNYIAYEYSVNGKVYSGIGYGPGHADLRTGERATVYYFPAAPSESVLASPLEQQGYVAFGLVSAILMGMFAGFVDYWNRQRTLCERRLPIKG